jgi:hypothetical protein
MGKKPLNGTRRCVTTELTTSLWVYESMRSGFSRRFDFASD